MTATVRAVLLDVDDTLVDTRTAMRTAGDLAARITWPDLDGARGVAFGEHYHADPSGFFGRYTRGELDFAAMRDARLRASAVHVGLDWHDDVFDRFEAAWAEHFPRAVRLFPDVRPFLARCADAGLRIGALTNSSARFTRLKLAAVGLEDDLGVVVTTDTLGFGKPDPRAFHHVCAQLDVAPGDCLYVGDDLDVDARGARQAGLVGVWLDRSRASDGLDGDAGAATPGDIPRITTLAEVPVGVREFGDPRSHR